MRAIIDYETTDLKLWALFTISAVIIAALLLLIAGLVNENKACAGLGSITSNTLTSSELESRIVVNNNTTTTREEIETNGNYTIVKLTTRVNVTYWDVTTRHDYYSVRVKSFTMDCIEPPKELGEVLSVNWEKRRDDCTYVIRKSTNISRVLIDSVIRETGEMPK